MKRNELNILLFLLFLIVIIIVAVIYTMIKPSEVKFDIKQKIQSNITQKDFEQKSNWIEKITKQNRTFSYPNIIYQVKE